MTAPLAVTKAEIRAAAIAAGIPADVADKALGDGLVLVDEPPAKITFRLIVGEPEAELGNFSVSRSGDSFTVKCWYVTCPDPVVFRDRNIRIPDLLARIDQHFADHHADGGAS